MSLSKKHGVGLLKIMVILYFYRNKYLIYRSLEFIVMSEAYYLYKLFDITY